MANKRTNVRFFLSRAAARIAPTWVAELALRRFATPPPPPPSRGFAAPYDPFELVVDGERVQGFAFGAGGPAVALVHGWGGAASQLGAFVRPLLDAGFRVLAFDAPAHGASGGRRSSLPHFTAALEALALRFGAPEGVVAHSFGCAASAIAMARGLEVQRAVFVAPFVDPQEHFRRLAEALALELHTLVALAERRYRARWSELAIVADAAARKQPLLVFHDRGDRAIKLGEAERIARAWPGAELRVTEGLGHLQILRDPAVVEGAVRFLSARAAAPMAG